MASAPGDLERAPPASTSAPGDYPIGTRACALGSMTIHWRPSHTTTALKVTVSLALGGLSLALFLFVGEVSAALALRNSAPTPRICTAKPPTMRNHRTVLS